MVLEENRFVQVPEGVDEKQEEEYIFDKVHEEDIFEKVEWEKFHSYNPKIKEFERQIDKLLLYGHLTCD